MPKSYTRAHDQVYDRAANLVKLFHQDLRDAGLKIDFVFVATDSDDAPALTLHGVQCMAVARIIGPKERAKGLGDCEVVIDEARWMTKTDAEKDAIADHEISHFELRRNKKGRVKLDPNGRPLLTMRKHDIDIGHFVHIAQRHGAASMEVQQMTTIYLQHKQVLFDFALDADLQKRLGEHEPSEKVKALAKEIQEASPAVRAAAKNFVSTVRKGMGAGESMSLSSGGHGIKIDKDGVHPLEAGA